MVTVITVYNCDYILIWLVLMFMAADYGKDSYMNVKSSTYRLNIYSFFLKNKQQILQGRWKMGLHVPLHIIISQHGKWIYQASVTFDSVFFLIFALQKVSWCANAVLAYWPIQYTQLHWCTPSYLEMYGLYWYRKSGYVSDTHEKPPCLTLWSQPFHMSTQGI